MTETKPFQECLSEIAVAMALHKNKFVLPTLHEVKAFRNIGFLTKLVLQCWERDPIKRPTIVTCPEEVTLGGLHNVPVVHPTQTTFQVSNNGRGVERLIMN